MGNRNRNRNRNRNKTRAMRMMRMMKTTMMTRMMMRRKRVSSKTNECPVLPKPIFVAVVRRVASPRPDRHIPNLEFSTEGTTFKESLPESYESCHCKQEIISPVCQVSLMMEGTRVQDNQTQAIACGHSVNERETVPSKVETSPFGRRKP